MSGLLGTALDARPGAAASERHLGGSAAALTGKSAELYPSR
jgi:hypothetical protein